MVCEQRVGKIQRERGRLSEREWFVNREWLRYKEKEEGTSQREWFGKRGWETCQRESGGTSNKCERTVLEHRRKRYKKNDMRA